MIAWTGPLKVPVANTPAIAAVTTFLNDGSSEYQVRF